IPMSFAENYHVGSQYVLNFNTVPAIKPFIWTEGIPLLSKFKGNHFYFFPNSYSLSGDMNRTFKVWENSSRVRTRTLNRDFRGTFRVAYKISDNLNSNYNMDTKRDITDPRSVVFSFNPSKFKLGREVNYSESWGTSYTPNLFNFLSHKFNFSTSYREDINSDDRARNANASKSYGMSGVFDFNKFFAARASKQSSTPTSSPPKGKTGSADKGQSDIQRAFYSAVGVMRFLTGWIRPITYDFNEHYGYSYPRLVDRARFMFRLGLTEDIGAKTNSQSGSYGSAISTSKSTGYTLSSGTEFLGGLKTNVTFSRKISKDVIKVINPQKSVATTFPDIDFTIQPLTTFDVLNPLITRFSPRTSYTRTKSAYYNLSSGFKTSEEVSTSQRPLLAFNIDVTRGVQINISTDRSVTEKKAYNTQTGKLDSRRRDKTSGLSISTKYSFSSPTGIKIPLFGRLKFNSTMSVAVEITRQKQRSEASNGNMPFTSTGERSDFMIVPNISYSFSSQITGGLSARWQDTNDIAYKRKTHARELRCWVNIRF
ncbi:MAG: hypothetical protein NTV06_08420, partial [candidate division Zixibacteria bacterium]|nr:hypothetical protein [candidate division Zixibacteria bacterium]